jgi:hypothetical protein
LSGFISSKKSNTTHDDDSDDDDYEPSEDDDELNNKTVGKLYNVDSNEEPYKTIKINIITTIAFRSIE